MPKNNREKKCLEILSNIGLPVDNREFWWVHQPERAIKDIRGMEGYTHAALTMGDDTLIWNEKIVGTKGEPLLITIAVDSSLTPKVSVRKLDIENPENTKLIYSGEAPTVTPFSFNENTPALALRNILIAWCSIYGGCREIA